ncbi:HD domain-containing protein [Dethiobacter alkaliphilus]|uniref:Metal dependent phosphohydrolase n=1 Tax=Dethiobacter alkaliphilus AHT 1 TaxID=555088 RepID=C0GHY4_DETAL|nr:HD domain-containing protein [Dethiobacter alkaliphilus]EEG77058.1 metal dependent phosphohydrolase [Dethiobacter alkaliphilus AHT 1]
MEKISYTEIKNNAELRTYIQKGDDLLSALGFTEHAFVHANKVAETVGTILLEFGFSEREAELGKIAGYMHDIGNLINRDGHAQSGAILAFNILTRIGMDPAEIALVSAAIGNHDEGNGKPINALAAALILADKSDVRRTRVRNTELVTFDIHDRVNYAVEESTLTVDGKEKSVSLYLKVDTSISSKMEYFEIFLTRMMMCRKAAAFLGGNFELIMNTTKLL